MRSKFAAYLEMTKPRAMIVVWVTAAAGFLVALAERPLDAGLVALFLNLGIGVLLQGGGSIALNQVMEVPHDRRMDRTRGRPMPSGRVSRREGLLLGLALSVVGTVWLAIGVNAICAILGGLSIVTYVLLYTPLKRVTTLNTAVGAVPGAIPPMMGWAAVRNDLDLEAGLLFAILFVWQFPHFLAIAWLHRRDYEGAGYAMLSRFDPTGSVTAHQMIVNTFMLWGISLTPYFFGLTGPSYALGATILSGLFFFLAFVFAARRDDPAARWMLRGSIVHISLLMIAFVLDKSGVI
ncbi:MAG: heme o synthase [Planctomycetota bacterium]